MALSAFDDRSHPPARDDLQEVLGESIELWDEFVHHISEAHEEGRGIRTPVATRDDLLGRAAVGRLQDGDVARAQCPETLE